MLLYYVIKNSKQIEVGIEGLIKKRKDLTLLERCSLIFSFVLPNFGPYKTGNLRIAHTLRCARATIIVVEEQ